jgi:quinohemoprotein amine dehydrogenase
VSIGLAKYWSSAAGALAMAIGVHAAAQAAGAAPATAAAPAAAAGSGQGLVRAYCSGCHREHTAGEFERISAIRKTPEGWVMTLFRMRQVHGVVLDDPTREAIVRYLADTQGLAPSESAAGRFALEQRPNAKDIDMGAEIDVMCGRCHSLARVSLQRRDEEEWRKLAHTHVGQWPSLEYQASGRDRPWWQIASGPLPGKLAALFPLSSSAWSDWKARPARDLSGSWTVVGHVPGGKDFYGTARIERAADGDYQARYELTDVTGIGLNGDSKAIVYTGYEWRGSAQLGDRSMREVYAVTDDGNRITGRWFDPDHAEEGGEWTAVRGTGAAEVLAVFPQSLRAGSTTAVTVVGNGLDAKTAAVSFGEATAASNVQREAHRIRALVTVAADAAPGLRSVSAGGAVGKLAVYRRIDQIDVVPGYGIARVGGGRVAPVTAQFEAIASTRLPGGELLPLGPVAAEWTSLPFNAEAKRTEDEKFAGHFDRRGRFLPGPAGPNPAREFSGDNVGDLTVLAQTEDGGRTVEGRGHLVVTVQRWITPPIY